MATERQYVVEVLDTQTVQIRSGAQIVGTLSLAGSRITGSTPSTGASLVTWLGNGQSALVGATVTPPAVRVLDAQGLPVAGSTVTFLLGAGQSAAVTGTTKTTDSNGVATIGSWSVGTTAGQANTLQAFSTNLTNSPLGFTITPTAGSAFSITPSGGTSQTTTAVGTYPSRLTWLVHDQYGNPVNAATGTITTTDVDGVLGASTFVTNSSGVTGTTYVAGQSTSTQSILAILTGSTTSARFDMTITPATPTLTIALGQDQISNSATSLPIRPTVIVQDGFDNVWTSGQTVQYVIVTGAGTLSSSTSHSGSGGTSEVDWKLGVATGLNQMEVSLKGISNSTVTFNASATNPTADTIAVYGGTGQSAVVNAATAAPMEWYVTGGGSPVVGQAVDLAITPSGSLSLTQVISSSTGYVRVVPTLGTVAGTYTVTATATGLTGSPLAITATATVGSASSLTFYTRPSSTAPAGSAFPSQPVIITTDVFGNQVSSNDLVTATLLSGTGPLTASNLVVTASGVTATYAGMQVGATGTHLIAFDAPSRSRCTSEVVASPPFADRVAFTTQPAGGVAGGVIGSVVLAIQDANGAVVTTATNTITLSLTAANNTEGATLGGTIALPAVGGYATFTPTVDLAGSFTLDAVSAGLTGATSAAFTMASTSYPNEPAGMTALQAGGFGLGAAAAAITLTGTASYKDASVPFLTSGGATLLPGPGPISPNGCATIRIPTTVTAGTGSGAITNTGLNSKNVKTAYYSFWFQMSSNWFGHSQGIVKMFMPRVTLSGVQNRCVVAPYGVGTGALALRVAFQSCTLVNGANGNSTGYLAPITGTGNVTRGRWYRVEIVCVGNTASTENGSFNMWLDGTLTKSCTVQWDATAAKFGQWDFNSTWGGTATSVPPDSQNMFFDHIYVSWKV